MTEKPEKEQTNGEASLQALVRKKKKKKLLPMVSQLITPYTKNVLKTNKQENCKTNELNVSSFFPQFCNKVTCD